MHSLYFVVCLLAVLIVRTECSTCTSWVNCPDCHEALAYNTDTISRMDKQNTTGDQQAFELFYTNFLDAIDILASFGTLVTNDSLIPHMSIQYLCCYEVLTYVAIAEAIERLPWQSVPVRFGNASVVCNYNTPNDSSSQLSIIAVADDESQQLLSALVSSFESAMAAANIPVRMPRSAQEKFHVTLAVVNSDYPIEQALQAVAQKVGVLSPQPIEINNFQLFFPPYYFQSSN